MLKGRGPIILVALIVAFLFSLGIHYVTASNSVESRVEKILDKNDEIIKLQGEKRELCKGLGDFWNNDLEGICEKQKEDGVRKEVEYVPEEFYYFDAQDE